MDLTDWLAFGAAALLGSYVQAVAGFAMGMIVMAAGGVSGGIPLPVLTAVVSLLSGVNIVLAIRGHLADVKRPIFFGLAVGQLPAIALGVCLMGALDRGARSVLYLALGVFIVSGSISMIIRPTVLARRSSPLACICAGFIGGLMGGLFAASGPVLGWFTYRQPLELAAIRATLLSSFALATLARTVIVGAQGGLTAEVAWLVASALPVVLLGTWLGRTWPPRISDTALKRAVFGLLLMLGGHIIAMALWS